MFKIWKTSSLEKKMLILKGLEDWMERQPMVPDKAVKLKEWMLEYCEREIDKTTVS